MRQVEPRGSIQAEGEVGGLNEEQVTRVFEQCVPGLRQCLERGAERVEYLAGEVSFAIEVDRSGALTQVHLEQSTLGDRETERCMLEVLKSQHWPAPVGGEKGRAHKSFAFDPPRDLRPPVPWSSEDVKEAIGRIRRKLEQCKQGTSGTFVATLYVDTSGKAISAGIAPPSADADAASECIVGVLLEARYPSPGSWPAKVSLEL